MQLFRARVITSEHTLDEFMIKLLLLMGSSKARLPCVTASLATLYIWSRCQPQANEFLPPFRIQLRVTCKSSDHLGTYYNEIHHNTETDWPVWLATWHFFYIKDRCIIRRAKQPVFGIAYFFYLIFRISTFWVLENYTGPN